MTYDVVLTPSRSQAGTVLLTTVDEESADSLASLVNDLLDRDLVFQASGAQAIVIASNRDADAEVEEIIRRGIDIPDELLDNDDFELEDFEEE